METFLIEVPHSDSKLECLYAIKVFQESGSHFLINADWGCSDVEHKAWITVNVDNKKQALQIIPPLYRQRAKITRLVKYPKDKLDAGLEYHQAISSQA